MENKDTNQRASISRRSFLQGTGIGVASFAALGLLGGRRGTLAFLIYLLLGIVGLPVFSGFSAGAGYCSAPRADICWAIWPPRSSSGASPPSWGKPFR